MVGQPLIIRGLIPIKVSLDKDYFPIIYQDFKWMFKSDNRQDVVKGLTLITISRSFRRSSIDKLPIDLSPITQKSSAIIKELDPKLLRKVMDRMGLVKGCLSIKDFTKDDLKIFNSAGPDGASTSTCSVTMGKFTETSLNRLLNLTGSEGRLYIRLAKFKSLLTSSIFGMITKKGKSLTNIFAKPDPYIRKLALVEDPELKARIVAIFDHYSQNILNLLSVQVFDILRKLPCDRTFTQSPLFNHKGYVKCNDDFHSLDLTSATDRFPLTFQKQILELAGLTPCQSEA
jgi:hypothetical protein